MKLPPWAISLRFKIGLAIAAVALVSTTGAAGLSYRSTRAALDQVLDESLRKAASREAAFVAEEFAEHGRGPDAENTLVIAMAAETWRSDVVVVAVLDVDRPLADERQLASPGTMKLPIDSRDRQRFAGAAREPISASAPLEPYTRDISQADGRYRLASVPVAGVGGVMVARSLREHQATLDHQFDHLLQLVAASALFSAILGAVLAESATKRLRALTAAASTIAATGQFDHGVTVKGGRDETGQLAEAFDHMITALSTSKDQQRRLVQDASHELRTPLTSLRTNLAVFPRIDRLGSSDRQRLIDDVQAEVEELVVLVEELVDHATETGSDLTPEKLNLGAAAQKTADRVTHRSGRRIDVDIDDSIVFVPALSLERAVLNLLNNAVKFSPTGSTIAVRVRNGSVTVTDEGSGFAVDDLPRVFDRFFRATEHQDLPGSGLGLSIVSDIANRWGGSVSAQNIEPHGAAVSLSLPQQRSLVQATQRS